MTAKVDGRPQGRDRLRALFTTSAVPLKAAFARTFSRLFARSLSLSGHRKRKAASRHLYQQTHDDLCRRLGRPPIKWAKR
jgi:hypothetical protein